MNKMIKREEQNKQNKQTGPHFNRTVLSKPERRSHVYRVGSIAPTQTGEIEVPAGCVGLVIGKGGKNIKSIMSVFPGVRVQGPKRGDEKHIFRATGPTQKLVQDALDAISMMVDEWKVKASKRATYAADKQSRVNQRRADWSQHIQDSSGCEGKEWETKGAAAWRHKQQRKTEVKKAPEAPVKRNRFYMGESDEEEDLDGPTIWAPVEPEGDWAKGASDAVKNDEDFVSWEETCQTKPAKATTSWGGDVVEE